jgi:hypothetical protein
LPLTLHLELVQDAQDAELVMQGEKLVERAAGCGRGQVRTLALT